MEKRRDISRNKFASGLLRGAAVAGLVSGLAAASLSGPPNADATCLGIFGISINLGDGGHCSSSLFGFALGLGPDTTATANGFFNAAIAVGTNTTAIAGTGGLDFLNLAFNSGQATQGATSTVTAGGGGFNLAANLGGDANAGSATGVPEPMDISAGGGFGNVALNVVGNRNRVSAGGGFLNFAVASGLFGQPGGANGSDNDVTATGSLSAALNSQTFLGEACPVGPCGNEVNANGPFSLVVAAGVVQRLVEGGITFANSFNSGSFPPKPPSTNVLAAGGTQGNRVRLNSTGNSTTNGVAAGGTQAQRVRPSLNAASNRQETTSTGGSVHRSVSDSTKKWAKKFSDRGSRSTSGLARNAKADADNTDSDK
jgi:hypothetical protein